MTLFVFWPCGPADLVKPSPVHVAGPGCPTKCSAAPPQAQKSKHTQPGLPDLNALSPQLQREWHSDNNLLLGGKVVKPKSRFRAKWECKSCPAGKPHIFYTSVYNRTAGSKCPYCAGRKACVHNSLATVAPMVATFWNKEKNAKTTEETLAGSLFRAEWQCSDCKHEWQARVVDRVRHNCGCPKCAQACKQPKQMQPTFEAAQHHLLSEWDYELNAKEGIHPHNTTLRSGKLVNWVCRNCPQAQSHKWQAMPANRTIHRSGCPFCGKKKVCLCNSLQALLPKLASEWDYARNDITPADVTAHSGKVCWWQNDERGSWQQSVDVRADSVNYKLQT